MATNLPTQAEFTIMPGVAGGFDLRLSRTFHLVLEGRLHYLPFVQEGAPPQSFGAAEVLLQAQWVLP